MAEQPNDASRQSKAEGDRWSEQTGGRSDYQSTDSRRDAVNRQPLDTPRRYDQPIEDDDDPVMPSDDTTLNTKI